MEEKPPVQKFKFPLADLLQLGDKGDQMFEIDGTILATYGFDLIFRQSLKSKNLQLKSFPTDENMEGQVKELTDAKDANADTVKVDIRSLMTRVKRKYPIGSGPYGRFATEGLDRYDDLNLVKIGYGVVVIATELLDTLEDFGVTQLMLDGLQANVKTFDDSIDAQKYMMRLRVSTTRDRINLGNEIYEMIVSCFDAGKDYWVTRNSARYKDYVIYNTPDGLPPIEEQFGTAHGIMKNSETMLAPANGLVTLDGVEEIIEVDTDGAWECLKVPVTCTHGHATADNCANREFNITIHLDKDTECNILMDPTSVIPPDEQ